ncbi:uncharacterized protein LOC34622791 [Cyclospora cayetanensis]|uniref:Signal recognition particle receptor subunit beta n=1 Tax=Cyclospora cayetanensis TaxID=88456 RepID=A0A6P6RX19_9EIME|nr:uncharacterized protein LOC34622791 [Cyclospora cayetanensis]
MSFLWERLLADPAAAVQENRCDLTLRSVASAAAAAPKDEGEAPLASSQDEIVVRIVDSPGSQRLRRQAIANAAASSLIVFIVDAADKPSLKQAAEFLFELFCNPTIYSAKTPLLLVANKRDRPEARGLQAIIEDVEREIERCRVSRQAALEAEDVAASFIGAEGRRFLLEDAPCPLGLCSSVGLRAVAHPASWSSISEYSIPAPARRTAHQVQTEPPTNPQAPPQVTNTLPSLLAATNVTLLTFHANRCNRCKQQKRHYLTGASGYKGGRGRADNTPCLHASLHGLTLLWSATYYFPRFSCGSVEREGPYIFGNPRRQPQSLVLMTQPWVVTVRCSKTSSVAGSFEAAPHSATSATGFRGWMADAGGVCHPPVPASRKRPFCSVDTLGAVQIFSVNTMQLNRRFEQQWAPWGSPMLMALFRSPGYIKVAPNKTPNESCIAFVELYSHWEEEAIGIHSGNVQECMHAELFQTAASTKHKD